MRFKNYLKLAMLSLALQASSMAWAQHEHDYVNGICIYEDCQVPGKYEEPSQAEDGFYELRNAGNVEWLGWQVSQGNLTICGRMMNDIDFEGKENLHNPIGPDEGHKFDGTWDGQGYRITNMILNLPEKQGVGFFGMLRGNGPDVTIKNFVIDKTCSITGKHRVGAFVGWTQNTGCVLRMENLVNEADVTAVNGSDAGAIVGGRYNGNAPTWLIRNCINTGKITANGYAGAIAGWMGDNANNRIENFINLGIIEGFNGESNIVRTGGFAGNIKNIIDLSGTEGAVQGVREDLTTEDIANGKLTFVANGDQKEIFFYQTIGEDAYPVPFSTSKQVYFDGSIQCDGTPLEGTYTNDVTTPSIDSHNFVDGDFYCQTCGKINTEFCEQIDSVYQLKSVKDVEWFSAMVNEGHGDIDAKLTCDLDMTEAAEFLPIGTKSNPFMGNFDGGFHTVSNLDLSAWTTDWSGFFGHIRGGSSVKNLRLDETCIIYGNMGVGLIGGSSQSGDIHLTNLAMEGEVLATNKNAGGILGCNTGSVAKIYMDNCYSTGYVTGGSESGAISGWVGSNGAVISRCWSTASVSGMENESKYMIRHSGATITDCFCPYGTQGELIDFEEVENGSLCYKLNGSQEDITWYQDLDKDAIPTFMPGHKQVYPATELNCDGSYDIYNTSFTNDPNAMSRKPHQYVDGFCSNCNGEDPEYPFIRIFANADHDVTTGYITDNSKDGSGLAINNSVSEHWNMKWFDTYQQISGLKKGVYKLRVQGLQRVCAWDNNGEEYGMGTLNEEFIPLYHSSQYYALSGGKKVASLFKDIAEEGLEESVGETENFNDYTGRFVPNSLAACNKYFRKGMYWNKPLYFYVENETDTVNIGVENHVYKYGNWTVWDTWRLEYVGDDDASYALIRNQQVDNIQDLSTLEAQASIVEEYQNAVAAIEGASSLEDILANADILSTNPMLIRQSHLAYQAYDAAVKAVAEERATHDNLLGQYADLLDKYLEDYEENVEGLPHGTYYYIIEKKPLSVEELESEITFLKELLTLAIKTSIDEGSDLTNLIYNPGFDEDTAFKGWTETHTQLSTAGSNFNSNSGFTDIYPVAGTWNTSFDLYQDMEEGLPNGIYMLEAPAFFRPGGNGMGELDGTDYVTASLYLNDFYTPIMNIYAGQVLYEDAVNGVNCRFDATGDPEAPHNGEYDSSQDFDTGVGYVPEQRQAVSFAFAGGRYINQVYGIVTDNKLRLGIRNTGYPYYESEMTMWGKFKLVYMGKSADAMDKMIENFEAHLASLTRAQMQAVPYIFSTSHLTNIEGLISDAKAAGDVEAKMEIAQKINEEFNAIIPSNKIYEKLNDLMEWCYVQGDSYAETDPAKQEAFVSIGDELMDHVYTGDLTDEEAEALYDSIQDNEAIGGGFYVQGDLVDEEGNNIAYSDITTIYPLKKNEEGKYVGRIKVQDRTNLPNGNNRASIYFSRLESKYKAVLPNNRFITPAQGTFGITVDGGNDFQTQSGEFNVTLDLENATVTFEAIDYKWNDDVFVVGSILDDEGNEHRWKNDEMCPLHHQGNGLYEGDVTFFKDPNHLNEGDFLTFTIIACRATTGLHEFTKNATRTGWNESRYGSETNELVVEDGETVTGLIRGADRQWWMVWDNELPYVKYHVAFDMNLGTVMIQKDIEDYENGIANITPDSDEQVVYNLSGQRVSRPTKGIYIVGGRKVMFK